MVELLHALDVVMIKRLSDVLTEKMVGTAIMLQGSCLQEEESLTWLVGFIVVKMGM